MGNKQGKRPLLKAIFVTGTDTGVGKTLITGYLARYLSDKGYSVITQKWIQTGCKRGIPEDIKTHIKLIGRGIGKVKEFLPHVAPYAFKPACSPHLAAKIENKKINAEKIKKSFRFLSKKFDFVIVEGVGGALVPFNERKLVIDIAKELDLPVLVVAGNKLGAINHTLLTIEALNSRKIKIIGAVFNNIGKGEKYILKDNPDIVKRLSGQKVLGILPYGKADGKLYQKFIPIGQEIVKSWIRGLKKT
jgi:dethiobiotin synthetase